VVQLRDDMAELRSLVADACQTNCASTWANQMAGLSAQNSGSRMATVDISVGFVPIVVSMHRRGRQCGFTHGSVWSLSH
jgi:hypothetical protein